MKWEVIKIKIIRTAEIKYIDGRSLYENFFSGNMDTEWSSPRTEIKEPDAMNLNVMQSI